MAARDHARWLVHAPLAFNALTGPWLAASGASGDERIVGVLLTAFCVLAMAVVEAHHRSPQRLLRVSQWSVPAAFGCTALVMLAGGAVGLGGYYGGIAIVSVVGVALAR